MLILSICPDAGHNGACIRDQLFKVILESVVIMLLFLLVSIKACIGSFICHKSLCSDKAH